MKILFLVILFLVCTTANCQTVITIEDSTSIKTALSDIDLGKGDEIIAILKSKEISNDEKLKVADSVFLIADSFYPPTLLALSRVFYENKQPLKAAKAYYLGMVRARLDMELSKDIGLSKLLTSLKMVYGVSIINYCSQHKEEFKSIIVETMERVDANIGNYDHRWIMFHSSKIYKTKDKSKLTNDDLIAPQEEWNKIKNKCLNNYYQEFLSYLESIK